VWLQATLLVISALLSFSLLSSLKHIASFNRRLNYRILERFVKLKAASHSNINEIVHNSFNIKNNNFNLEKCNFHPINHTLCLFICFLFLYLVCGNLNGNFAAFWILRFDNKSSKWGIPK
jgi:hypothetical protein